MGDDLTEYGIGKDEPTAYIFREEQSLRTGGKVTNLEDGLKVSCLSEGLNNPIFGEDLEVHEKFQRWYKGASKRKRWFVTQSIPMIISLSAFVFIWHDEQNLFFNYNMILLIYTLMHLSLSIFIYAKRVDLRTKKDEEWNNYRMNQLILIGLNCILTLMLLAINFGEYF